MLALVMAAALAVTAYAASVTVKYRVYVYSDEITFRQYDYSQSTTPSITNLTISATSSLGSGSALYHMKYADGAVAYCIEPGVHSDDSGSYVQGSSGCWYNLPASVQSAIALVLACGYPSTDYGTVSGDRNSSAIVNAEKWAATQAIIWELICEYRSAYTYDDWGYSPFYDCVDTSRYPTFGLWYDKIGVAKWSDLKIGVKYRVTETKAPAGYTLLTEPLFTGVLDSSNRDITITACNNAGFILPFTGGTGFTTYILLAALMLCMGVYFAKNLTSKRRRTEHEKDPSRIGHAHGRYYGFEPHHHGICRADYRHQQKGIPEHL